MKFSGKVGNGPMNDWLNFGGSSDYRLDTAIVFLIRHRLEIRKVVHGHSFILIRQMTALVRRALVEACTVPVLLVANLIEYFFSAQKHSPNYEWRRLACVIS